jgi:TusA-related sulfurtransferase
MWEKIGGQPEATSVLDTAGKCGPISIVKLNYAMKELALGGVLKAIGHRDRSGDPNGRLGLVQPYG